MLHQLYCGKIDFFKKYVLLISYPFAGIVSSTGEIRVSKRRKKKERVSKRGMTLSSWSLWLMKRGNNEIRNYKKL